MLTFDYLLLIWIIFFSIAYLVWYIFKDLSGINWIKMFKYVGICIIYAIFAIWAYYQINNPMLNFMLTLAWIVLVTFLIKRHSNLQLGEIIFIFFIIMNYNDAMYLFVYVWEKTDLITVFKDNLVVLNSITFLIINIICFPIMLQISKRVIKPIVINIAKIKTQTYLWIVPVCFFLIYQFCIRPTIDNMNYNSLPIINMLIPVIWFIAVILAHCGSFITLKRTIEAKSLEEKIHVLDYQNHLQQEQYRLIENQFKEAARIRHDSRHQVLTIREYLSMQEYDKADAYLGTLLNEIQSDSIRLCDNLVVEAIVQHYLKLAKQHDIKMEVTIHLPPKIQMNEQDIIAILGNLLENAYEACLRQIRNDRFIELRIGIAGKESLMILVTNSYEGTILNQEGTILSSKRDNEEGIGLSSVKKIVNSYSGIINITYENQVFNVKILLNQ